MSPLFTTNDLAQLTQKGEFFVRQTNLNIDTYCYIISRIFEAAMKGETMARMPAEGLSDIQEIADLVRETHVNGVYINWLQEQNEIEATWRNY